MRLINLYLLFFIFVFILIIVYLLVKKKGESYVDYGIYDETPVYGNSGVNYEESPYGLYFSQGPKVIPMGMGPAHQVSQALQYKSENPNMALSDMNPAMSAALSSVNPLIQPSFLVNPENNSYLNSIESSC
jgi:hypothetical protein